MLECKKAIVNGVINKHRLITILTMRMFVNFENNLDFTVNNYILLYIYINKNIDNLGDDS